MTLTDVATTNYEPPETAVATADERISIMQLPKIVWAGAVLFSLNAIIGIGMFITPNMQLDMFGHEVQAVHSASHKPSPFTEVVDNRKKKVQGAAKVRPVLFEPSPSVEQVAMFDAAAATTLDIPRTSRAYQLDLPVRTQPAVYEMPRKTERAIIHQTNVDIAPRRASEGDKKFVVIN